MWAVEWGREGGGGGGGGGGDVSHQGTDKQGDSRSRNSRTEVELGQFYIKIQISPN